MKKKTAKKEEPQIELLGTFQVKVYETPGLYMRQPVLEGTLGDKNIVRALLGVNEEFERMKKNEALKSGDGNDV